VPLVNLILLKSPYIVVPAEKVIPFINELPVDSPAQGREDV